MFAAGDARVDFDADFGVGGESEVILGEAEEIFDLRGSEIGGSAAAPVELDYRAIFGDMVLRCSISRFRISRYGGATRFVFLDDDVAGAEEAEAFAERNVHVEGDGGFGGVGLGVDFFEVGGAEGVVPDGGGGIAGVAGAGAVVAGEEGFAYAEFFAHGFESGIRRVMRWFRVRRARVGQAPPLQIRCTMGCWPVSIKSLAFSTGVCWRMPWPRFRMWPTPPRAAMASCVARRIASGGAKRTAGSTLPWRAMRGPSFSRSSRMSTRQSTLRTFAPERATAGSR